MRISDWSSDVCSSDLPSPHRLSRRLRPAACPEGQAHPRRRRGPPALRDHLQGREWQDHAARRIFRFGARCRIPQVRERVMTVNQVIVIAREAKQSRAVYATLDRSEEHTSELKSLMRISYAVFCLKKKTYHSNTKTQIPTTTTPTQQ